MPIVDAQNFYLDVARGNITNLTWVNKFGRAVDFDTGGTYKDLWDGWDGTIANDWAIPSQARLFTIRSDAGADTSGGTGASSLKLYGLKTWDSKETNEIVTLNGASDVTTSESYVIVHRMKVIPSTTGVSINVGVISAAADVSGGTIAYILSEQGQTQMAIYGIPSIQNGYMTQFYASFNKSGGGSGAIDCDLKINPSPDINVNTFLVKHSKGYFSSGDSGGAPHPFRPFKNIEGPAIVKLQINPGANDLDVSGGFDIILHTK